MMKINLLKRLFNTKFYQPEDFENLIDEKSQRAFLSMLLKF